MAVILAQYTEALEYAGYSGLYNNEYTIVKPAGDVRAVEEGSSIIGDVYLYIDDVSVPAKRVLSGAFLPAWFEDYYNRIIITPSLIPLGVMTAEITEDFYVWNAWLFESKTLSAIDGEGTDGVELTGYPAPQIYTPLMELHYEVAISLDGPSTIDATYTFDYTSEEALLIITGQRLVVWTFPPLLPFTEELVWKTDVIRAFDAEQRIAIRDYPRQALKAKSVLTQVEYSLVKGLTKSWDGNYFGVPIWTEATEYGSVTAGEVTLTFNTTMGDYVDGGFFFIWESNSKYTSGEIIGLTASEMTIKYPIDQNYSNAKIMPMKQGVNNSGFNTSVYYKNHIKITNTFVVVNSNDIAPVGDGLDFPTYLGEEVATIPTLLLSGVKENITREVDFFDNGQGIIKLENQFDYAKNLKSISWYGSSEEEIWNHKAWLYSKVGKQKRFWVISWKEDMQLIEDIVATHTHINVEYIAYDLYQTVSHIVLIKKTGEMLFKEVLGGSEYLVGFQTLSLESTFGEDIAMTEVDRICFMYLVRFDTDKLSLKYIQKDFMKYKATVREVPLEELT